MPQEPDINKPVERKKVHVVTPRDAEPIRYIEDDPASVSDAEMRYDRFRAAQAVRKSNPAPPRRRKRPIHYGALGRKLGKLA